MNTAFRLRSFCRARTALLAGAVIVTLASPGPARAQETITVVSWGGSYARASVKAYHQRFTAETGIEIRLEEYNGGLAQIRAQAETEYVVWDVIDIEAGDALLGCDEGLLEEADYESLPAAPDGTPATEDFVEGYDMDCGVKMLIYSTVLAYNSSLYPERKPERMEDLFDLKTFPGRRGLRRAPNGNLEFALLADGVPADQIYETLSSKEGIDRAFRKLDTIKKEVLWWEAGAQPPQMLADGEVAMSIAWNGRIFNAQVLERQPLSIVWDGQLMGAGYLAIVAGTARPEAARRFLAFASSTQSLANLTRYISYGPMRRSALALVDKHEIGIDMRPHMPNAPDNAKRAIIENPEWWADHQDELNERFAAWLIK